MKRLLVTLVLGCVFLSACQTPTTPSPVATAMPVQEGTSTARVSPVEIAVSAAASLTESFNEIGAEFEAVHPEIKVTFNYAGSQALAEQINNGAPVDVFASASKKTMQAVIDTNNVAADASRLFLSNKLVLIVPATNPGKITQLQDLAKSGLKVVLAAKEVPVGQYALDFLAKAAASGTFPATFSEDVLKNVVSYEDNVKAVLTKVSLGEADAGIVYLTDAASAKDGTIQTISIPDEVNIPASYFIAPIVSSEHPDETRLFIDFVLSKNGQVILAKYGFIPEP